MTLTLLFNKTQQYTYSYHIYLYKDSHDTCKLFIMLIVIFITYNIINPKYIYSSNIQKFRLPSQFT